VTGLHDGPTMVTHASGTRMIRVDLSPPFAFTLLGGIAMEELVNNFVDLSTILPDVSRLSDKLAELADESGRRRLLRSTLAHHAAIGPSPSPEVRHAHDLLCRTAGRISIRELAIRIGWSRQQLARRFRREVGLSPKGLARVLRLQQALPLLLAGDTPAAVAARIGFSDQAHLTREFQSLTGRTPTKLLTDPSVDPGMAVKQPKNQSTASEP
jgi:AraC-like DNA-binding protein